MPPLPQKSHPVALTGVPLAGKIVPPVPGGLEGHGHRQAEAALIPPGGRLHGLHPQLSFSSQLLKQLQLWHQARADVFPQEVVFLPRLGILHPQCIFLRQAPEKPPEPLRVPPHQPACFQGVHPLQGIADIGFKIVDGIRPQKPEHRNPDLVFFRPCREEKVLPAGIIDPVGPAAPEGKAVHTHLVPADGPRRRAVPLRGVGKGDNIQHPGADRAGIFPENIKEIRHIGVHQPFAFLRRVADGIGGIHPVIIVLPRFPAPEPDAGPEAKGLCDLPPGSQRIPGAQLPLQKRLVLRLHEGVVLYGIGAGKTDSVDGLNLSAQGIKIILYKPAGLIVGHPDHLIKINNGSLFHSLSL